MKFIKRVLTALLSGCLCLVVLLGAAAPDSSTPPGDDTTNVSSEAVALANFSPGQTVNTREGGPYTSVTGHQYGMQSFIWLLRG